MNIATKYLTSFITIMSVVIASITSASDDYTLLTDHSPIQSTFGFSVTPPSGDDWYEKYEDHLVTFTKKLKSNTHTFFIGLEEIQTKRRYSSPNDFLTFIKKKNNLNKSPYSERFKQYKSVYNIYSVIAPYCVKYHETAEDHKVPNRKGIILFMENEGIICLNPKNPELGVHVYYSDRYEANNKVKALQEAGKEVFESLKLIHKAK